jgi:hypothetical protein
MMSAARQMRPGWAGTAAGIAVVLLLLHGRGTTRVEAAAQGASTHESVRITVPPSVTFRVINLSSSTQALGPSVISFSNAQLRPGRALRISVRAEARRFLAPFGPTINVHDVTWRATNAVNGTGFNGGLDRNAEEVYESVANAASGGVTLEWTLAPPPAGIAAGSHTVLLRWRLTAVNP